MRTSLACLFLFCASLLAADPKTDKKPPQKSKEVVELEALEIKAKLQEPTLMYILEQPSFDIDPPTFNTDFIQRMFEPIEDNAL